MNARRFLLALVAVTILGTDSGRIALADDAADAKAAEAVLEEKGLRALSSYLAVAEETDLSKMFREVPRLRKAVIDAERALGVVDQKVAANKKLITTYTQKRREINAALGRGGLTVEQNNQLVTAYNELGDRITLLIQNGGMEKELTAARGELNTARDAYIQHVLNMQNLVEQIRQKYLDVAADEEVKAAVEKLNKATGKSYAVTESRAFLSSQRSLKRLEDTVLSESIELRADGSDTYMVATVLNGKYTKELCVDSGSSLVSLPYAMAREVGLNPDSSDEDIILKLADGREIQAKLVTIPEIRVGKFILEDVEAAVMPRDLTEAAPILGMSFLRNFNFKIDPENAKLTMSKVETPSTRPPRRN